MEAAVTVTGSVPADTLGVTITHEHLISDISAWIDEGYDIPATDRRKLHVPVSLDSLWKLRDNPRSYDNYRLDSVETAVQEAMRFKAHGGQTIVEVSSFGLHRDPVALREIAERTGLNIIAGTGYYVRHAHPPDMDQKSPEEIAAEIVSDIQDGIHDTAIKAGIIGEIGTTHGFATHENERASVQGAAYAQQETGAPITLHSPIFYTEIHDVLNVLEDAGANLDNVIVGHLDGTIRESDGLDYHCSIADRGPFIQFDTFGRIGYGPGGDHWPLDEDRVAHIMRLIDAGYEQQILLSQDIATKTLLTKFGGPGYDHVLRNIVPRFRTEGLTEATLDQLLVANPAAALSFA